MYPVEHIPDEDRLFRRILSEYWKNNNVEPGAFSLDHDGISCDWEKYSTPQQSVDRGRQNTKRPFAGVVSFICGALRIESFAVNHTPSKKNRAHSSVSAENDEENRIKLSRLHGGWVLKL